MDKLKILIGDDSFASEEYVAKNAVSNMFVGMAEAANYREAFPIKVKQEGKMYVGKNVIPYADDVHARAVSSVDELLSEARQGEYDLIVTDLQYGRFGDIENRQGTTWGGERVIDALQGKHTLALCTSSYVIPDSSLGRMVDILASPEFVGDKFELLGREISRFYMTKENKNEECSKINYRINEER